MMIENLLVIGSSSYIATKVVPLLEFEPSHIYAMDRNIDIDGNSSCIEHKNRFLADANNQEQFIIAFEKVLKRIGKNKLMVLNFIGDLGDLSFENKNYESIFKTIEGNLRPNLFLANLTAKLEPGSLILSFSGAGIGGEALDDSSLGYLSAKASLAVLIEVFDNKSSLMGVRFGLVAPGAYPSRMQKAVATSNATHISLLRKSSAERVLNQASSPKRLVDLLEFLRMHPELAGGRIWSAVHDHLVTDLSRPDFGKLRRIF